MKKFTIVLTLLFSTFMYAQDEIDTVTTNIATAMYGIGIQGGPTIINPEYINNQIEFVNEATNSSMRPVRSAAMWGAWMSVRPKNMYNYISLRAEYISSERSYSSVTQQTDMNGSVTGSLETSVNTLYTLYPLSLNVGAVIPKTAIKFEIGFVYAFSSVEEGNTEYRNIIYKNGGRRRVRSAHITSISLSPAG